MTSQRAPRVDHSGSVVATGVGLANKAFKMWLIAFTVLLVLSLSKWLWPLYIFMIFVGFAWLVVATVNDVSHKKIVRDKHFAKYGTEPKPW